LIKIKDYVAKDYVLLPEDATVWESLAKTGDSGKILVINDAARISGIVPNGKLAEWCKEFPGKKVAEMMERDFLVITEDNDNDPVLEELLTSRRQDLLPVLDGEGKLTGVLDKVSILKFLLKKSKSSVEQSVVLNATHGIIAIDNLGRVVKINAAAERILDISAAEVLGKLLSEVVPPSGLPELTEDDVSLNLETLLDSAEKEAIQKALAQTNNNKRQAANLLGIHRSAVYQKIKKYDLQ
jgi:transcriptional regulator with PAS, ATPase and Fis domain